jgi:hypothetical protein
MKMFNNIFVVGCNSSIDMITHHQLRYQCYCCTQQLCYVSFVKFHIYKEDVTHAVRIFLGHRRMGLLMVVGTCL